VLSSSITASVARRDSRRAKTKDTDQVPGAKACREMRTETTRWARKKGSREPKAWAPLSETKKGKGGRGSLKQCHQERKIVDKRRGVR